jgi:chromosome segregation ATPase
MRLHRLHLVNVRGTVERTVALADQGVTIIEGPNEAGKSTLLQALDALLGQLDSSKASAVRRLQPLGRDVGPEVTAELTVGGRRLHYRKRWLRSPLTELSIEPGGQRLTGRQAHERVRQLLEEHVDWALWEALRMDQGRPLDAALSLATATSLGRALDAASTGVGDEDTLLERARALRSRYLTDTRRQPTGELRRAIDERDDRVRVRDELRHRRDEVDSALADLVRARQELADLAEERRATVARRDEVERAHRELQELAERADRARLAAANASLRADDAERRRDDRHQLVADVEQAAHRAVEATDRRARAEAARQVADRVLAEAEQRHQVAEAAERAASDEVRHLERLAAVADHRARLAELHDRVARAHQADERCRGLEAQMAAVAVGHDELSELQQLQAEEDRALAQLQVAAPTVVVEAATDLDVTVGDTVEHVAAGQQLDRSVTDQLLLDVPGVLRATVQPGSSLADLQRSVDRCRRALRAACERLQVVDVAAAAEQFDRRQRLEQALADAHRDLDRAAGDRDLAELDAELAALRADLATLEEGLHDVPDDLLALLEQPDRRRQAVEDARRQLDEARLQLASADDRRRQAEDQARDARREHSAAVEAAQEATRHASEVARRLDAARAEQSDQALDETATQVRAEAARTDEEHRRLQQELGRRDRAVVEEQRRAAHAAVDEIDQQIRSVEEIDRKATWTIDQQAAQDLLARLADAEAAAEEAEGRWRRVQRRAEAAALLVDTLERHRAATLARYSAPLTDAIGRLATTVLGEPVHIELDVHDLAIARVHRLATGSLAIEELSAGAKEQIALATRVAAAQLVARGPDADRGVPIVLDDVLGSSDPDRLARLVGMLRTVAVDAQVIVLTCQAARYRGLGPVHVERLDRQQPVGSPLEASLP